MNEFLDMSPLDPEGNPPSFARILTRPTPLPPEGIKLGVLEVSHMRSPQGNIYPETESYYCSMIWGISGQFSVYVNGSRHTVRTGQFLLLRPGGSLRVEADEADNHGYYLLLDGPQASDLVKVCGLWNGVFPYSRSPSVWLGKIAANMGNLDKQDNLASIAYALLMTAFQDATHMAPDKTVWDACCYIHKNWNHHQMNVEKILAHLNVSRSTLSPRFRKVTGKSILQYLMEIRYSNALQMLLNDYSSVSTIAYRCGFPDTSYFSTWFRRINGASPRDVKRRVTS